MIASTTATCGWKVVEHASWNDDTSATSTSASSPTASISGRPTLPAAITAAVAGSDVVVPSPLVRVDHPALDAARRAGIEVHSEIDLAGERATAPIVAVTGTNGKTTVTTLTAAMLDASGRRAVAAGNVGRPLIDAVGDDADVLVAEVSSFQLACSTSFHPHVAVVLAITPDHLDWHGSYERYVSDKARITAHQTGSDLLVFDADDADASAIARSSAARVEGFSRDAAAGQRARVVSGELVAPDGSVLARVADMRRALVHDRTNALAAALAARAVGATPDGIRGALSSYATLPHRVALVGKAGGVSWYDDSKATNPDATLRALESFDSVVLLAGGRNKGLDLGVLARAGDRLRGVVAFGEAAPEVERAFRDRVPVVRGASMRDAVRAAAQLAQPGDAVLLSPACASFDAYANYAARGDDFVAEVRELLVEGAPHR